jgi:hypothetical protein
MKSENPEISLKHSEFWLLTLVKAEKEAHKASFSNSFVIYSGYYHN